MDKALKKVDRTGDCWIWTGAVNSDGYPRLSRDGDCNIKGHRFFYEHFNGPIPDGYVVRHTCDNILCVNPNHLVVGTQLDNIKDRVDRRRSDNNIPPELYPIIKRLRSQGLSQLKVAKIVGCSQKHISNLERGVYTLIDY